MEPPNDMHIYDNRIDSQRISKIFHEVARLPYYYGEQDNPWTAPTGMVSNIHDLSSSFVFKTLNDFYMENKKDEWFCELERAYVNIFAPGEMPFYHTDADFPDGCTTLMYYANPEWIYDHGGETKFIDLKDDSKIISVAPIPGRIVIFNGNQEHTATSFRSHHRFSVVLKYGTEEENQQRRSVL